MKYRESHKDAKLRTWFKNDLAHVLLKRMYIKAGFLRSLTSLDIAFEYPITVFAGKNGSGKSTILALACCAFHASAKGFKLPKRKNAYYTFSDFFIQQVVEQPLHGIEVHYSIAHNNWKPVPHLPDGKGVGTQVRKKKKGGKWNDYDTRAHRTVVFLGIERIVPHSERSQSKSYARVFKDAAPRGWEKKVMGSVGYILGKTYTDFKYLEHYKYSLPFVTCEGVTYSGFNMGAGENALFDIFSTIHAAGDGALLVIDEVELGLHSAAQRRFIERLKDACIESHIQVICTTHSKEIFDCLPLDARFYVETVQGKTKVTQGISSDFAFSKMNEMAGEEIEIFVEDEVAKAILLTSLPVSIRSRVTLTIIGSANALARQLAALYVRQSKKPVIAVFDGDQLAKAPENFSHARNMAETPKQDFPEWYAERVCHLPGNTWPEAWLLSKAAETPQALAVTLGCEVDELEGFIVAGLKAGKHNEFHEMAKYLGMDATMCLQHFASHVSKTHANDLQVLREMIETTLNKNC
jgi:predicted ATPase